MEISIVISIEISIVIMLRLGLLGGRIDRRTRDYVET